MDGAKGIHIVGQATAVGEVEAQGGSDWLLDDLLVLSKSELLDEARTPTD